MSRPRIVFMGTPQFAVTPLEYLLLHGLEVAGVYTRPDKPAGRERAPVASPVKLLAEQWQVPVFQPASLRKAEAVAGLAALRPDLIVLAAYGLILPKAILEVPARGALNIHPSLLPRFRGPAPIAAAILAGDEFTGVSIMLMDEGMDTGPILAQAPVPVLPHDTAGSLGDKLALIGAQLVLDVMPGWLAGRLQPRAQDEARATYSRMLAKQDGEIDWRRSAVELWRRVRALQPWPGCYTTFQGKPLRIVEAAPLPPVSEKAAGKVVVLADSRTPLGVVTGDGVLGLLRVQLAGKRVMTAAEFARGQRGLIGAVLPC